MKRANEQAFPANLSDTEGGMTLREYFAGLAMQGMLGNTDDTGQSPQETAELSIKHADALIAELEKPR